MNRTKILTLLLAVLALVAVGHHQLVQMSKQAMNTPLVPLAYAGAVSPTPTASPTPTPINEGCTPGFWKNNALKKGASQWPSGFTPDELLSTAGFDTSLTGDATLLAALQFQGGSTLEGAAEILLRAAVAAVLNAAKFGGSPSTIISEVNSALASGDRDTILGLASTLDAANNLGCPLPNN
jgi:hypothetical protein